MEENQNIIRRVGPELSERHLNFKNRIFHSFVTTFDKSEFDSGLSIKYVISGEERYTIGDKTYKVTAGRFIIVNHHQQFVCKIEAQEPVEGFCFYLDPDQVNQIYQRYQPANAFARNEHTQHAPLRFMEKLYSVHENELGQYLLELTPQLQQEELHSQLDFKVIFNTLAQKMVLSQLEINNKLANIQNTRKTTRIEIFKRVSRVRNFIDDNYLEDLNLEDLASLAFLSKYHFLRCFKHVYGISPYQYVIQRRLAHSQTLLDDSQKTLSEIAYQTGFIDRRAFNRAFRKAFGHLPAEYRQA